MTGAQVILGPLERKCFERARLSNSFCGAEHFIKDCGLPFLVLDVTHDQAKRMLDQQRPRRFNPPSNARDCGQGDRAQPRFIEYTLDQSDGLIADRSGGDEQGQVDSIRDQAAGHLSGIVH